MGDQVSSLRYISSFTKKLRDMAWKILNTRNHIVHTPIGPTNMSLLEQINIQVIYNFKIGITVSQYSTAQCAKIYHI